MWACSRHSHSGVQHEVRECCFFCSHLFAPSPRSECLEQANLVCLKIPMFLNNSHTQTKLSRPWIKEYLQLVSSAVALTPKSYMFFENIGRKKILFVQNNLKGKAAIGSLKNKAVSSKKPILSYFFLWSKLLLSLIKTGH